MKSILCVIDTDLQFFEGFSNQLKYAKLGSQYEVINIAPDASLEPQLLINQLLDRLNTELSSKKNEVVAFFVDIVVKEIGVSLDSLGLDIAEAIREVFPGVPVFNVTGKMGTDQHMDAFSEATLRNKDGVLSKYYIAGPGLSKARLEKLLTSAAHLQRASVGPCAEDTGTVDVAILTALHDDEFENIEPLFDWNDTVENENREYQVGTIQSSQGKELRVVAVHQTKTGIVDAAVIAAEILNLFRPRYLLMPGVCGSGKEKVNIGDVIIAKEVFLFQKGKETDEGFERDVERCMIDDKLVSTISRSKTILRRGLEDKDKSRDYSSFKIHIEPMACSLSVIDKEGYFQENIMAVDRNVVAVDMESYAITRACELSGENHSKAIIVKGVMDNTVDKDDNAKAFASYSSAIISLIMITDILPFD